MIIVLKAGTSEEKAKRLMKAIEDKGLEPLYMPGAERTVLGALGDERILGDSQFVARAISIDELDIKLSSSRQRQGWNLDKLVEAICCYCDISESHLVEKARSNQLSVGHVFNCLSRSASGDLVFACKNRPRRRGSRAGGRTDR